MNRFTILLCSVFLILSSDPGLAQDERYGFGISVGPGNKYIWTIKDGEGNPVDGLTADEAAKIFEDEIFPDVLAKAEAGKMPQLWRIGFFHLEGKGTQKDLSKAKQAFLLGLANGDAIGAIRLANHHYLQVAGSSSTPDLQLEHLQEANELFLAVLAADQSVGNSHFTNLVRTQIYGWYGIGKKPEAAEELLNEAIRVKPEDPNQYVILAQLHQSQKKSQAAFESVQKAIELFEKIPKQKRSKKSYKQALLLWFQTAQESGNSSNVPPKQMIRAVKNLLDLPPVLAWAVPIISALVLIFLIVMNYLSRRKGVGLILAVAWLGALAIITGIGFMVDLPGIHPNLNMWIGMLIFGLGCLIAISFFDREKYWGTGPLITSGKSLAKTVGLLVGIMVLVNLLTIGYSALYELCLGKKPETQAVAELLKSETIPQLLFMVFIAGIVVPFYEEVVFRGFIFDAIKRYAGTTFSLIVTSVIFAIIHGLTYAIPIFFLALVLGWFRIKTGNLRLCFALHALNNITSVLASHFFDV